MSKESSTVEKGLHHNVITVGTTPVNIPTTGRPMVRGVTVKTPSTNAGTVYVGSAANVSATTGFPLALNETLFLPVEDLSQIWVVASASAQEVRLIVA
jgi:hypothetical protein